MEMEAVLVVVAVVDAVAMRMDEKRGFHPVEIEVALGLQGELREKRMAEVAAWDDDQFHSVDAVAWHLQGAAGAIDAVRYCCC